MGLRVLVVQHGEKERRHGDPGLTESGRAQAAATARWLGRTARVDALWSSPLRRARETAAPIAARVGLEPSTDARLRERMNWEGEHVQSLDDFLADWARATEDRSYVPASGDSSALAAARFLAALDDLALERADGTVVVVAHGGVTVDALRTILGDAALERDRPDLLHDGVPCCAVTTLGHEGGRWTVAHLPSTDHLDGAVGHRPA